MVINICHVAWVLICISCLSYVNAKRIFINYAYNEDRIDARRNLKFFLSHAVYGHPNHTIDYGLVINGACDSTQCLKPHTFIENKKLLLKHHIIRRDNVGYDFGAHGAMISKLEAESASYDYYMFLNSGVIGPFFDPNKMKDAPKHWVEIFTNKIKSNVGIVGTTIACVPETTHGALYGPKVEGFSFLLSKEAFSLASKNGTIFYDHRSKYDAIHYGEYRLSTLLLTHNVSMDCLLTKYQGYNWLDKKNWKCNSFKHPSKPKQYFGKSVHPYEVVLYKQYWKGKKPQHVDFIKTYEKELYKYGMSQFNKTDMMHKLRTIHIPSH